MLKTHFISAQEKDSKRLMVMLHGLGDSVMGYLWLPDAMRFPWLNYVLVNAPDEYFGGYSWFDFAGDLRPGVRRSRRLLFDLLDSLRNQGFPTDQTVFGGFSQGALMSVEVGCRYPHKLAGIVAVSGYVCEPDVLAKELSAEAKNQRFLMTHGTFDPLIPIDPVREQVKFLKTAGLDIKWHEFEKEHTIAEDELEMIRTFVSAGYGKAA
jgi:phospholipase/carboxylesterase